MSAPIAMLRVIGCAEVLTATITSSAGAERLMEGETDLQNLQVLLDPFGMAAYMASSRYYTAAELNAGAVPVSDLMVRQLEEQLPAAQAWCR